jgi:gliding motility-associated-like protein
MEKETVYKLFKLAFLFFLFSQFSFSQLSNFTLNVTSTPETCLGNGALNFSVTNTVTGSNIDYSIYLLPNVTTPIATITASSLTGLNAGNYRVVATQSLGANSGSQQQDIIILNQVQTLTYSITSTKVRCGNDGVINVNVTSGNPVSYQIISGPVVTPLQASNVFSNLPVGVYQIRVFDNCGEAVVQTYTLQQALISLVIDSVTFGIGPLPSCDTIAISNFFGVLTGYEIAFPLTFEFTVFPPGGGTPLVYTQTVNGGTSISQVIPFYNNQSYFYNLKATDACGNVYNRNNNVINKKFDFEVNILKVSCTDIAIKLAPQFYVEPYTINFISSPAGFNPVLFNANHPGPFTGPFQLYGAAGNSVPEGSYTVQMTDSCGRTSIKTFVASNPTPLPIAEGSNNGCGKVTITSVGVSIVSVIITGAPSSYPTALPHNVSNLINPAGTLFLILGLPEGTYTFQVTDACGLVTVLTAVVAPYLPPNLSFIQRPGCQVGYGSIIINDPNSIATAVLINAPSNYVGTLPQNLTSNIDITSGTFYFGTAPQGNYTFQFTNGCGAPRTDTITINGYQVTSNNVTITENCGSFNLLLQHVSNGTFLQSYWLQKYNPTTNQWTHPGTGFVYVNGTPLTGQNAVFLNNNVNNLNLAYSGQFRIMKGFKSLVNDEYVDCYSEIHTFEFLGGPKIINVYAFLCSNNTNEVIVEATGIPPLTYSITTKNGLPFVVNNGTNNSFTNLQSATYNFQVQDVCGNIVNSVFDITDLEPLAIQSTIFCDGQNGSLSVPLFSFLNYEWWQASNPSVILSTSNELNLVPYNSATQSGTYYVKISNQNNASSCVDTILEFTIPNNTDIPNAGIDGTISYCGSQGNLDLFTLLSGTFDTDGVWEEISSSGLLSGSSWNSNAASPGSYQFKYKVTGSCALVDESFVNITLNEIPQSPIASVNAVVCDNEDLELFATTISGATYQWTGPNGFSSSLQNPVIIEASNVNSGIYTVKTLLNGCESIPASVEVVISQLPQFTIDLECINNVATLTATTLNNSFDASTSTYNWSNSNGYSSSINPTAITGEDKGIYTLTVTNTLGCSTTQTINVLNTLCAIPKGLTPNADGANDTFDLSGFTGVRDVKIFNRYGMVVFEQDNYTNQWYGQQKGSDELLPDGTYYYLVNFEDSEPKTGWVYLLKEN